MRRPSLLLLCGLFIASFALPVEAQKKPGKKPTPEQTPKKKAEEESQKGIEAFSKGDYNAALTSFLAAANLDPDEPNYLFNAGLCHAKLGDYNRSIKNEPQAVKDYQAAIDIYQALLVKLPKDSPLRTGVNNKLIEANQKQAELKFSNDQDKDGIGNDLDACPSEAGPSTTKGCPDQDNDGVTDKEDACQAEAGPGVSKGCPDQDADGVADKEDACATQAGVAAEKGCPSKAVTPENPDETKPDSNLHKVFLGGAGAFGAAALGLGAFGLSKILISAPNLAEEQDFVGRSAQLKSAINLGYVADGCAVAALVMAGVGLKMRPKKEAASSVVLSPSGLSVVGSF